MRVYVVTGKIELPDNAGTTYSTVVGVFRQRGHADEAAGFFEKQSGGAYYACVEECEVQN